MTGKYNTEMQKMKNYIKTLQEKLQLNNEKQSEDSDQEKEMKQINQTSANVQLHIIEN